MDITPKKGIHDFVGKIYWQKAPRNFLGKFEEIRAKVLRTPKNLPAPTPVLGPVMAWSQQNNLNFLFTVRYFESS